MTISNDKAVAFHYTLKNDEGKVLDSSFGQEPLHYLHGHQNIIPGLESQLEGLKKGEKKKVVVSPENGYGTRNDDWIQVLSIEEFGPDKDNVELNAQFYMEGPDGSTQVATVTAVDGDQVTLDLNHPLADQTLHFDIEIVSIRDANQEELEHGHIHGPGGVQHDH